MRMPFQLAPTHLLSIHPFMFFVATVALLWVGTLCGAQLRRRREKTLADESSTFKTLESAVLALLGLLLGFTFSMGVSRYDQRKNLEIAEANDIKNVWLHMATLPQPLRGQELMLMRQYVPARLSFLEAGTSLSAIRQSLHDTDTLQRGMWDALSAYTSVHPDPVSAHFLSAMTDMVDISESRTAAFENRIPLLAWGMLLFISFVASMLVGIGMNSRSQLLRFILPVVVASALSLTLDLDSPRSGWIRVHQHSLERVAQTVAASQP